MCTECSASASVYIRDEDGFGLNRTSAYVVQRLIGALVSLMEDGVLMAPAPYAAPAAYYFPLTTRLNGLEVYKDHLPSSMDQHHGGAILHPRPEALRAVLTSPWVPLAQKMRILRTRLCALRLHSRGCSNRNKRFQELGQRR